MNDINDVVDEFRKWAGQSGLDSGRVEVKTEYLGRPHHPTSLPKGWQGIYTFRYGSVWLKIGKAGPKSGPRWLSQHYNAGSALSTLAYSLILYGHFATREDDRLPGLRTILKGVHPDEIGEWIKGKTERTNVLISADWGKSAIDRLEVIAHHLLKPVFEGTWKFGNSLDGHIP